MDSTNNDSCCHTCAKCHQPIDPKDEVEIQGQMFHRDCAKCCLCKTLPTSLIFMGGHICCEECFNNIAKLFKANRVVKPNGWWLHWDPYCHAHQNLPNPKQWEDTKKSETNPNAGCSCSKCIRCLKNIDDGDKVVIDGQTFHTDCARCCVCHAIPKSLKLFYGSVFCEECFQRHIMSRNPGFDHSAALDFFKACFEQHEHNLQFANNICRFMGSSGQKPTIFVVPPQKL